MRTGHIQNRNMVMQAVLAVITLSIYVLYWYYATLRELHIANGKDAGSGFWTFLLFIPIANLFAEWHYCSEASQFTGGKYPTVLLFVLWIVFFPVVWILVQPELNRSAPGSAPTAAAGQPQF